MKSYRVVESFRDRYTGEWNPVGKTIELSEERAGEILAVGYLIEELEEDPKGEPEGKPEGDPEDDLVGDPEDEPEDDEEQKEESASDSFDIQKMTVEALRTYAATQGIDLQGAKNKKEILTVLMEEVREGE